MKKTVFTVLVLPLLLLTLPAGAEDSKVVVTRISSDDIVADRSLLTGWELVSSGQPDIATLEAVKDAGFTTVIDFRAKTEDRGIEEATEVESLGLNYFNLPIASTADVTYENAAELNRILSAVEGPVLMHCSSGNRVGAILALRERLEGASVDVAMSVGKAAGLTRFESVVARKLAER